MKRAQLKSLPAERLIEEFKLASAEHGRALEARKTQTANRKYDLLVAIRRELRERGIEAQRQLLPLLEAPEAGTRCWTATSILEFSPTEGERVLAELARTLKNAIGVMASLTLEQWKEGTFSPP